MSKGFSAVAILVSVLALVSLTGCVQTTSLSKVNRAKYGRVSFAPNVEMPGKYSYTDATITGTRTAAIPLGVLGVLAAQATVVAAEEKAGRSHVQGVIERSKIDVPRLLNERFQKAILALPGFASEAQSPQATFHLSVWDWGFASGGSGKLAACLTLQGTLIGSGGETIWRKGALTVSSIVGTPEEFQRDGTLYTRSFDQVVTTAINQLTTDLPPVSNPNPEKPQDKSSSTDSTW
ncbi:MAG: hypothetical protein QM796_03355 [Chthoniobacteraceae bacterium]